MAAQVGEHATLRSPAISCGGCVATVQKEVGALEGVNRVQASAETKLIDVDFDSKVTNLEAIKDVLSKAGYPAQA